MRLVPTLFVSVTRRVDTINRWEHAFPGYFASYLPKLSCYVYGPFGRCTGGVSLLPCAHRASP
jgi:hypothetical protein